MVLKALARGVRRTISSRGILLPLYLSNVVFSVALALMFFHTLSSAFGDSRASLALLAGFDSTIVGDLRRMYPSAFPAYLRIVGIGSLLYILLNTFLAGGVISGLQASVLPSGRSFLRSCATFFGRFLRLFLLTGSIAVLVTTLFLVPGGLLISSLYRVATTETTLLLGGAAVGVVVVASVLLLVMVADYAKIGIVLHDTRSVIGAVRTSLRFFFRNPRATLGLQTILLSITLLAATLHALFWTSQPIDSVVTVFLFHQLFLLVRIITRVVSFGAESALFKTLQPAETVSVPEERGARPHPSV
jgi:hypothetical protein